MKSGFSPNLANTFTERSPLRYPGGKTRGVSFIKRFIPAGTKTLLSPFFGGGSLELSLAAQGVKVTGYDVFLPLVEFWQSLQQQPAELAEMVLKYYPLEKSKFYALQQSQTTFETKLERAAVYYILNRASFSGATLSGGMSPGHPRFTPSSIERLRNFHNPNFQLHQSSFQASLTQHPDTFAYLDPPYLIKSSLYGKKGNAHKDFDHEELAAMLKNRKNWLLSYNDNEVIRHLYKDFRITTPGWKYGMSADKQSKEVLILSPDLKTANPDAD